MVQRLSAIALATLACTAGIAKANDDLWGGRIFTIASYDDIEPYGYIHEGEWVGSALDIGREVCKAAGAQCRFIPTPLKYCWETELRTPGQALLNGVVDACGLFFDTVERKRALDFTEPVIENAYIVVWTLPSPSFSLPLTGSTGVKLGFIQGAYYGEAWLRNTQAVTAGATFDATIYNDAIEANAALVAGEIDGIVNHPAAVVPANAEFFPGFELMSADAGFGGGYMMRKDNTAVLAMLNEGIRRIKSNGSYKEICAASFDSPAQPASLCFEGAKGK